jgi:hypothetical protein
MKKNQSITAVTLAGLMAFSMSASAQIIEQWTFDGANPETGINGTSVPTWTTASPNSAPSAGVLRYETTGSSGLQQSLPDIDTTAINQLVVTYDMRDLYVDASDAFRLKLVEFGGNLLEIRLGSFSTGQFYSDIYLGGARVLRAGTSVNFTSGYPSGLGDALTIAATFDFANDTLSLDFSGAGTAGWGTTSWSGSAGTDLSAFIPTITGVQTDTIGGTGWATWIEFDTVTIETSAIPEPATFSLVGMGILGLLAWRRRQS